MPCWLASFRARVDVWTQLIIRTKGDPWKLTDNVVEELRATRYSRPLQSK